MVNVDQNYQVAKFSEDEFKRRWTAIRRLMVNRLIDCLIVVGGGGGESNADLRYISNIPSSKLASYCLVPLQGDPSLYVTSEELQNYAKDISWIPEIISCSPDIPFTSRIFRENKPSKNVNIDQTYNYVGPMVNKIKALGLEKSTIGVDSMATIQHINFAYIRKELPEANFVEAGEIIRTCCQVRSPEELEYFRKAQEIGEKGFLAMANAARPGITDREILGACMGALVSAGADPDPFILFNSSHWPSPRPLPDWAYPYHAGGTERKLQKGDIVFLELYSSYAGYYSDICLPISIGKPSPDFVERFEICKGMCHVARDLLHPGSTRDEIDAKVSEYLSSKLGKTVVASAGLKLMEPAPRIPRFAGEHRPGMVVVIPPITMWDRGPNHLCGETFIVTEGEPEKIGKLPTEIFIVD